MQFKKFAQQLHNRCSTYLHLFKSISIHEKLAKVLW